jgi:phosphoglucosamine mutase
MTPELALRLGRALAYIAKHGNAKKSPRVLIGKDTRLSGYMLETALAAGICAMGGRVMLCGPIPTPAVANLTQSMRADMGVVISASHNPFGDNGIKIFGEDGFKLPDRDEAAIEAVLEDPKLERGSTGAGVGSAVRIDDAVGRYIVYSKNTFPRELTLNGVRVVIDAAHGAAYKVAPAVLAELGAEVIALGVKPNGRNINRNCGAMHPEHVQHEVKKRKADIGIALDGDADRLIVVDEFGQIVDGDAVMALCATRMIKAGTLPKKLLVTTVMSNMGLQRALEKVGGRMKRTQVGDRYVVEEMRRSGATLGGEQSGHLIFLNHATTGDGTVAALQVLATMVREERSVSELATVMQRVPQVLKNLQLPSRQPIERMAALRRQISLAERKLGKNGRVLVRWSGTEAKLRLMVEGPNEDVLHELVGEMALAAEQDLGVRSA